MTEEKDVERRLATVFNHLLKRPARPNPLSGQGVTLSQWALLNQIAEEPGCSQRRVADALSIAPSTVTVGVRRLEQAGFVERRPNPHDHRARQLFLTPAGQARSARALSFAGQAPPNRSLSFRWDTLERLLAGLTAKEAETLLALLEKGLRAIESDDLAAE